MSDDTDDTDHDEDEDTEAEDADTEDKTDWSIPAAQRLAEGASIIAAAQPDAETASEHDILYFGTPEGLSAEARERLAVLGWFVDSEFDCMAFFT